MQFILWISDSASLPIPPVVQWGTFPQRVSSGRDWKAFLWPSLCSHLLPRRGHTHCESVVGTQETAASRFIYTFLKPVHALQGLSQKIQGSLGGSTSYLVLQKERTGRATADDRSSGTPPGYTTQHSVSLTHLASA